jgi:hypothetical protein
VHGAVAGNAARQKFAAVVDKSPEHSFVFVIDIFNLVVAEAANFFSSLNWHIIVSLFLD